MIIYVPSSAAKELSEALWELSRPASLQNSGDTTQMFGWIDDAQGNRWIEVYDDFSIIIHPNAELGKIADLLQPWIDSGQLPPDTNTNLADLIESKRGQPFTIYDAFPDLFKDMSKTHEEMVADGLLAE
jgi:hypothetical protein